MDENNFYRLWDIRQYKQGHGYKAIIGRKFMPVDQIPRIDDYVKWCGSLYQINYVDEENNLIDINQLPYNN